MPKEKTRILFVGYHNAARSQMAEGYMRKQFGDRFDVSSAGIVPTGVHPLAIEMMNEIGIDISQARAKTVDEFSGTTFDTVVTLCDAVRESCPFFPGMRRIMAESFTDPEELSGSDEEIRTGFRMIRNEITRWIDQTFSGKRNQ